MAVFWPGAVPLLLATAPPGSSDAYAAAQASGSLCVWGIREDLGARSQLGSPHHGFFEVRGQGTPRACAE